MSKAKVDTRPVPKLSDIENFFSQYKEDQDGEGEVIGPNGIMKLCGDLKIDPADVSLSLPDLLIRFITLGFPLAFNVALQSHKIVLFIKR